MKFRDISEQIKKWDKSLILKFNGIGGKRFTKLIKAISFLGRETIWLLLIAIFSLIWFDPKVFSFIAVTYLIGIIIVVPIKQIVRRKRPYQLISKIKLYERESSSSSFPSWHSYNVISQAIVLTNLISLPFIWIILFFLTGVVCFSRIQLGSHYPSDVIVGSIIGIYGGISTIFLFGPILTNIIYYIQEIALFRIVFYDFNPFLFSSVIYILICVLVFLSIILLSSYKLLKSFLKKKNNRTQLGVAI